MTDAQKNIREISRLLSEFSDGWLFIGFNPSDQEPITGVSCKDGKTETAINAIMAGILQSGGVGALRDQIKEKEKENDGE